MGSPRLAVLIVLGVLAGCGEDEPAACTEIGCQPATAQVQMSGLPSTSAEVELCADQECTTVRGTRRRLSRVAVGLPESAGNRVRVRVVVRARGRVIVEDAALIPVETLRPNGPDCPPVCRFARARLDLDTGRLEPVPSQS